MKKKTDLFRGNAYYTHAEIARASSLQLHTLLFTKSVQKHNSNWENEYSKQQFQVQTITN